MTVGDRVMERIIVEARVCSLQAVTTPMSTRCKPAPCTPLIVGLHGTDGQH